MLIGIFGAGDEPLAEDPDPTEDPPLNTDPKATDSGAGVDSRDGTEQNETCSARCGQKPWRHHTNIHLEHRAQDHHIHGNRYSDTVHE